MMWHRTAAWLSLASFILATLASFFEVFWMTPQITSSYSLEQYYLLFIKNSLQDMPLLLIAIFFALLDIGDRLPKALPTSEEEAKKKGWWRFWR